MADTKIHDLTGGTAAATDEFAVAITPFASGDNRKLALSDIKTFVSNSPTLVTPNLGTPSAGVLSSCSAYPFSSLTGSTTIAQSGSTTYALSASYILVSQNVVFTNANSDTAFTIQLPTGFTKYACNQLRISSATATLTTATCGVFTATGGGGTALLATSAIAVSNGTDGTSNNMQAINTTSSTNISFTLAGFPTLYFRVLNAAIGAATATVQLIIIPIN